MTEESDDYKGRCVTMVSTDPGHQWSSADQVKEKRANVIRCTAARYQGQIDALNEKVKELNNNIAVLQGYIAKSSSTVQEAQASIEDVYMGDWNDASLVDDLAREFGLELPPITVAPSAARGGEPPGKW